MTRSGNKGRIAGDGPRRRTGLPAMLGASALLFALYAVTAPAGPAPASGIEPGKAADAIHAARPAAAAPAPAFSAPAAAPDPAPPGFTLVGVFTEPGGRGSAILAFGGDEQRGFRVGQELAPGIVLKGVQPGGVTVLHNGAARSIRLGQGLPSAGPDMAIDAVTVAQATPPLALPAAAPAPASPANAAQPPGPSGESWSRALKDIAFAPRRNGAAVTGAVVQPASSESARIVGLLAGDVVLSVGGRKIASAEAVGAIGSALASRRDVVVQVQRGQRVQRLQLRGAGDVRQ